MRADGCVKKPFTHGDLIPAVAKFLTQPQLAHTADPPAAVIPTGFEFMAGAEATEKAPDPVAPPALDLTAFSGGIALMEPSGERTGAISINGEQEPISENGSQVFQSQDEKLPTLAQDVSLFREGTDADTEVPGASALVEDNDIVQLSALESEDATTEAQFVSLSESEESENICDLPRSPQAQVPSTLQSGSVGDELEVGKELSRRAEESEHQVVGGKEIDPDMLGAIVRKVVFKMSPPALGPDVLENIVGRIITELAVEFGFHSS